VSTFVLRRVEVAGRQLDVSVGDGVITAIAHGLPAAGVEIDGQGGALIAGLHDHHLHLMAMAAASESLDVRGDVLGALRAADAALPPDAWIRAVAWQESTGWALDRQTLDHAVSRRPVRVQHASGALWVLNTAALEAVGLAEHPDGRLYGMDAFIRERLDGEPPSLDDVSRELAAFGVTSVTDATPYESAADLRRLQDRMMQRVTVTGAPSVEMASMDGAGPAKIVVADHDPPSIESLVEQIHEARRHGRNVALHCASRLALVLTLTSLESAGVRPGDRIEHGAVIPDDAVPVLRRLGLTVVTQPCFVAERGDRYLVDVDDDDRPFLWRCGSLIRAGIKVLGSSDAPYASADPGRAIAAAVHRCTRGGAVLGADERIVAAEALRLYGGRHRVEVGAPADLCLLRAPLVEVLAALDADAVNLTLIGGSVV
jgi:predicted amidohydrolase YtcJ